jgi:hypothetical protein
MSAKNEKAARRAAGISKHAARAEREFEALVRARRLELNELPIVSLQPQRRAFAVAVLALFGLAVALSLLSSVFGAR